MTLFSIKRNGTDITDKVTSYNREHDLCTSKGVINIETPVAIAPSVNLWDTIVLYEDSRKVGTYNVAEYGIDAAKGTFKITAQDDSKRMEDYFVDTQYTTTYGEYARQYIEMFLSMCGVSYTINGGDGGPLSDGGVLGLDSVYNLVMNLMQMSSWYLYFNPDGTAVISSYLGSGGTNLGDDRIINIDATKHDRMLRNRAVVWGGGDPLNGTWVFADVYVPTPWDYDSADKRTITYSNYEILSKEVANTLANQLINEFSRVSNEAVVRIVGSTPINVSDGVNISSRYYRGLGTAYKVSSYGDSGGGQVTEITVETRCPRLFGYAAPPDYVYIGTEGSGIWRKPIDSSGWYFYGSGISDPNIYDLFIANGVMATTTYTGFSYLLNPFSGVSGEWIQVLPSALYDEYDGITYSGGSLHALVCTVNSTTNEPHFCYNIATSSTGPEDLPEWRSWVVRYSSNDYETFSGMQVSLNGNYNYAVLDIDSNEKENIVSVETVGEVYLPLVTPDLDSWVLNSDTGMVVVGPAKEQSVEITQVDDASVHFSFDDQKLGVSEDGYFYFISPMSSPNDIRLHIFNYDTSHNLYETTYYLEDFTDQFPAGTRSLYSFYAYAGNWPDIVVVAISGDTDTIGGAELTIRSIIVNQATGLELGYEEHTYSGNAVDDPDFVNGRFVKIVGDSDDLDVIVWERDKISGTITFSVTNLNLLEDETYTSQISEVGLTNPIVVVDSAFWARGIETFDGSDAKYFTATVTVNQNNTVTYNLFLHKTVTPVAPSGHHTWDSSLYYIGGDAKKTRKIIRIILQGSYDKNPLSPGPNPDTEWYIVADLYLPEQTLTIRTEDEYDIGAETKPAIVTYGYTSTGTYLLTSTYPEKIVTLAGDTTLRKIDLATVDLSYTDWDYSSTPYKIYSIQQVCDVNDNTIYGIVWEGSGASIEYSIIGIDPAGDIIKKYTSIFPYYYDINVLHMFNEMAIYGNSYYNSYKMLFWENPSKSQVVIYQVLKQTVSGFDWLGTYSTRPYVEISKPMPTVVYDIPNTFSGETSNYLQTNYENVWSGWNTYSGNWTYSAPASALTIYDARVFDIITPSGFYTASGTVIEDPDVDYCYPGVYSGIRYVGFASSGFVGFIESTLTGTPTVLHDFTYASALSGVPETIPSGGLVSVTHLETNNYGYNPYFFVSTSGNFYASGVQKFYQRNPLVSGFIDYSEALPESRITIIRVDERI